MSRWTAGLAVAIALTVAGCGGGGEAPPHTPSTVATTGADAADARRAVQDYSARLDAFAQRLKQAGDNDRRLAAAAADPPRLRELDSGDAAYVRAHRTAGAVATTARELRLVAGEPAKRAAHLSYLQYDIGSDHWQDAFDRGNRRYDRLSAILYADDGGFADTTHRDDLRVQRIWRQATNQEIASLKRFRGRMDRLKTHNALERSFVDYALDEYDRSISVLKEFRAQMHQPTDRDQIGYYTSLATGQSGYHDVAGAVTRRRDGLERGLVRTIRRLAAGQPAAPGDAYRTAIASGFISPLKKRKTREAMVAERAWMLFRIRQIERTPPEAYEAARGTLQLENIDDARNPYSGALEVYKELDLATEPRHGRLPLIPAYQKWAHMKLTQPFPPLLQPMVDRLDAMIGRYPTKDTVEQWHQRLKLNKQMERALRQGAKAADDPQRLKAALKDALDATRAPA